MKDKYEIVKTTIVDCPKCEGKGSFGSYRDDYGSLQTDHCNNCFIGMIITKSYSSGKNYILEYCKNLSKDDLKWLIKELKSAIK